MRHRPDYLVTEPFPSVWSLKRAAYAWEPGEMLSDNSFLSHRDFADALFGMVRLTPFNAPGGRPECAFTGEIVQFIHEQAVCDKGAMCECWVRLALQLANATVVAGTRRWGVRAVRLPSSRRGEG